MFQPASSLLLCCCASQGEQASLLVPGLKCAKTLQLSSYSQAASAASGG